MNPSIQSNYYEVVAAFLVAITITVFFSAVLRSRGPWGAPWLVFVIIFLAAWAANLWISPVGPQVLGVSVLPVFVVGLIFAFVLAATSVTVPAKQGAQDLATENPAVSAVGLFFWILLIILVVAIATGYFKLPAENSRQLVK